MEVQATKKTIKEYVIDFILNKSQLFSKTKRGMNTIEEKVIDVIHREISRERFDSINELKRKVDEIMISCLELADEYGFVKIIYDFVLLCNNNY